MNDSGLGQARRACQVGISDAITEVQVLKAALAESCAELLTCADNFGFGESLDKDAIRARLALTGRLLAPWDADPDRYVLAPPSETGAVEGE